MKRLMYLALILSISTFITTLKGDCEECKKLRDELHKSWQATLNFSREIRELTKVTCNQAESIRKMNGV